MISVEQAASGIVGWVNKPTNIKSGGTWNYGVSTPLPIISYNYM
jgi:hypothetical protein